jgi:acyl-coenzyme A synthetase/AMP-(fatty) acid ligase
VSGRNSDAHVLMLFAAARVGAIRVPVNPEFGVQEARYALHHAEVSGVLKAQLKKDTTLKARTVDLESRGT